jgi:hypothetical protein
MYRLTCQGWRDDKGVEEILDDVVHDGSVFFDVGG